MKKKLQLDLAIKTMTTKVSVNAHARLKEIAEKHGFLIQDVLSACLLHMPEERIVKILTEHKEALDELPKATQAVLRNLDKLSEAERRELRKLL
jgi:hypothetical protein